MSKLSEDYGKRTKWHDPDRNLTLEANRIEIYRLQAERDKYKAQRDELLATLREITEVAPRSSLRLPYALEVVRIADNAIAKVEADK